jgi:hypothetical protein
MANVEKIDIRLSETHVHFIRDLIRRHGRGAFGSSALCSLQNRGNFYPYVNTYGAYTRHEESDFPLRSPRLGGVATARTYMNWRSREAMAKGQGTPNLTEHSGTQGSALQGIKRWHSTYFVNGS